LLLPAVQVGTPERPLSDLGRVSYRSYWTRVLMPVLKERQGSVSIKELSELTCIKPDDIIYTLQYLGLVQYQKGQHVLVAAPKLLDQHLREAGSWGLQVGRGGAARAAATPLL
jgi:histone acetyltransferase MYST1